MKTQVGRVPGLWPQSVAGHTQSIGGSCSLHSAPPLHCLMCGLVWSGLKCWSQLLGVRPACPALGHAGCLQTPGRHRIWGSCLLSRPRQGCLGTRTGQAIAPLPSLSEAGGVGFASRAWLLQGQGHPLPWAAHQVLL